MQRLGNYSDSRNRGFFFFCPFLAHDADSRERGGDCRVTAQDGYEIVLSDTNLVLVQDVPGRIMPFQAEV
ncbi:MAG: hypothetical protein A4E54_00917 [Pelotomaculum sp. PtaB.Bin117]|nr:MAG: hypothetical protein A4E54_00917 [Pelotomaculum sp. PtaB.Bin117]